MRTRSASRKKVRGIEYGGKHRWTARDRLLQCETFEVDIEEVEYFPLGPDELNVGIRHNALHALGEQQQRFPRVHSAGTKRFLGSHGGMMG